jgi:hypothetical protein
MIEWEALEDNRNTAAFVYFCWAHQSSKIACCTVSNGNFIKNRQIKIGYSPMSEVRKIEIMYLTWDGTELQISSRISNREEFDDESNMHIKKTADVKQGSLSKCELMAKFHKETENIFARSIAAFALERLSSSLSAEQRLAYDNANLHVRGLMKSPLLMMITGDGGSGKSYLTKTICKSTFLVHGRKIDRFPSLVLDCKYKDSSFKTFTNHTMSDNQISILKHKLSNCKLFIMTNIQFLSLEELYQVSNRMGLFCGQPHLAFGGTHTILEGDLYQHHHVNGTHLLDKHVLEMNLRAKAGHSILTEHMNYFVNLGIPLKEEIFDKSDTTRKEKKMKLIADLEESTATVDFSQINGSYHTHNSSGFLLLLKCFK